MTSPHIAAILKGLPEKPGVYIMRDEEGTVLYVGKAIKLKRRVSSYFRHSGFASPRLRKLVSLVRDISIIRTESEAEALIVEAKLIRRYSPFFNIDLKMSDRYPYIRITNEDFPRLAPSIWGPSSVPGTSAPCCAWRSAISPCASVGRSCARTPSGAPAWSTASAGPWAPARRSARRRSTASA